MPRKSKNKPTVTRISTQSQPKLIPILQMLSSKTARAAVPDSIDALEQLHEKDPELMINSMLLFLMQLCDLNEVTSKIDFENRLQSLEDVLEEAYEASNANSLTSRQNLLVNSKNPFHQEFLTRLRNFFKAFISFDFPFIEKADALSHIRDWVGILSKSKIRSIRSCSIKFMRIIVERQIFLFKDLMDRKKSKLGFQILKNIKEFYEQVIKHRFKDIDSSIRLNVFELFQKLLLDLETDFLSESILRNSLTPLLEETSDHILESCLELILQLSLKCTTSRNQFLKFARPIIKNLEEIVLIPNKNSLLALKILKQLKQVSEDIDSLKPGIVSRVFEIYSHEKYQSGLQQAIQIFYRSIYPTVDDILSNKTLTLVEIINLLSVIGSNRLIEFILEEFFKNTFVKSEQLFKIDLMFVLLMSQYYNQDGNDIQLVKRDIEMLMVILIAYAKFVQKTLKRVKETKETKEEQKWVNIAEQYNNQVLTNCKEIFHEKIMGRSSQSLNPRYLQLFANVFTPVTGTLAVYTDFIAEKSLFIFEHERSNVDTFKQTVSIFHRLKTHGVDILTNTITNDSEKQEKILKISAILTKYPVEAYLNETFLREAFSLFAHTEEKNKLEILQSTFLVHQWIFRSLMEDSNPDLHVKYIQCRQCILEFLFIIIGNTESKNVLRECAFNTLCRLLRVICNSNLIEYTAVYYELSQIEESTIYCFLNNEITFGEKEANMDLSFMMNNMNFENKQVAQECLELIFSVYSECPRLAVHRQAVKLIINCFSNQNATGKSANVFAKQRFASNFLRKMIQMETTEAYKNKFVFWKIVSEIIKVSYGDPNHQIIVSHLLDLYFKKKSNDTIYKALTNKLVLFFLGEVERVIEQQEYQKLDTFEMILRKVHRRYSKDVLYRINLFVIQKAHGHKNDHLDFFTTYMAKIGKMAANKKKPQDENGVNESEFGSEEEENGTEVRAKVERRNGRVTRSISKRINEVQLQ